MTTMMRILGVLMLFIGTGSLITCFTFMAFPVALGTNQHWHYPLLALGTGIVCLTGGVVFCQIGHMTRKTRDLLYGATFIITFFGLTIMGGIAGGKFLVAMRDAGCFK